MAQNSGSTSSLPLYPVLEKLSHQQHSLVKEHFTTKLSQLLHQQADLLHSLVEQSKSGRILNGEKWIPVSLLSSDNSRQIMGSSMKPDIDSAFDELLDILNQTQMAQNLKELDLQNQKLNSLDQHEESTIQHEHLLRMPERIDSKFFTQNDPQSADYPENPPSPSNSSILSGWEEDDEEEEICSHDDCEVCVLKKVDNKIEDGSIHEPEIQSNQTLPDLVPTQNPESNSVHHHFSVPQTVPTLVTKVPDLIGSKSSGANVFISGSSSPPSSVPIGSPPVISPLKTGTTSLYYTKSILFQCDLCKAVFTDHYKCFTHVGDYHFTRRSRPSTGYPQDYVKLVDLSADASFSSTVLQSNHTAGAQKVQKDPKEIDSQNEELNNLAQHEESMTSQQEDLVCMPDLMDYGFCAQNDSQLADFQENPPSPTDSVLFGWGDEEEEICSRDAKNVNNKIEQQNGSIQEAAIQSPTFPNSVQGNTSSVTNVPDSIVSKTSGVPNVASGFGSGRIHVLPTKRIVPLPINKQQNSSKTIIVVSPTSTSAPIGSSPRVTTLDAKTFQLLFQCGLCSATKLFIERSRCLKHVEDCHFTRANSRPTG